MSKTTFKVQATVTKEKQFGTVDHFKISLEGNGFTGEGEGYGAGSAFDMAYQDLVAKLLEGTSA